MIKVIPNYQNKEIEYQLKKVPWSMHKGIRTALFEIGAENIQQTKKFIYAPPKTGRIYNYRGKRHQASAPGQSPANRSGFLARSLDYRVSGIQRVEFFSTAKYSNYLEDGTENMQPRPYFIRTSNAKKQANFRSLQRHVYDRIK